MRHSPVSKTPIKTIGRPRYRCFGCDRPLHLDGIRRVWPWDRSPDDRHHPPCQHLITEVVCNACSYPNFIGLPTSTGFLFGLPDELAATLLAGSGDELERGMSHSQVFASRARFWALAHHVTQGVDRRAKGKEAGNE